MTENGPIRQHDLGGMSRGILLPSPPASVIDQMVGSIRIAVLSRRRAETSLRAPAAQVKKGQVEGRERRA